MVASQPRAVTDPLVAATPAAQLVHALAAAGHTVATAESLTAGLLSATIAGVPGASAVLRGGLVVYATDLKHTLAGVPRQLLTTEGPVAASSAEQLADGARTRCQADWGVGVTGVAGPDPQGDQRVGTVFLGISGPAGMTVQRHELPGDRWAIRLETVRLAISALIETVTGR